MKEVEEYSFTYADAASSPFVIGISPKPESCRLCPLKGFRINIDGIPYSYCEFNHRVILESVITKDSRADMCPFDTPLLNKGKAKVQY